jgi:acid phosphatase type 7
MPPKAENMGLRASCRFIGFPLGGVVLRYGAGQRISLAPVDFPVNPRRALLVVVAFVLLESAFALEATEGGASSASIWNGPYLQHVSSTSVDIRVELDAPSAASVDVEAPGGADAQPGKRTLTSPPMTLHTFHVDGLAPETRYRYTVHTGASASPTGEFVTAPKDDSPAPFAFIAYGDTRSNAEVHAAVVRAISHESFEFLVNTGDSVLAGGDKSLWHEFFSIEKDLLRDHCVFACIGNHELGDDQAATNYLAYFGPNEPSSKVLYGSFRWQGARFFLLNAFQDWGEGELSWLQRELDRADGEPNLVWRIAVVHHSPWSSGRHGNDRKMLAAGVPELLARHHVDLILAGHDHIYERGEAKGIKYVITGGGGAPLYTEHSDEPSTRHFDPTYNFVRVSVDGDTLRVVGKKPDGAVIEECGFHRGQSWDCDAIQAPGGISSDSPPPQSGTPPAPAPERKSSSPWCSCRAPGATSTDAWAPIAIFPLALALVTSRRSRRRASRSRRA